MSPADCLRLFILLFWLLVGDVNCENTHRGYVRHVQAPMGVHNGNRHHKRWREPPVARNPTAGYKTSSVDRGKSDNIYPAQEEHTTESSQIQSHYLYPVIPETQNINFPKSHLKSGFTSASAAQGQSNVVYDCKKTHQENSDSVSPRIDHTRTKSTGSFPPVQVDKAPVRFGPNNRRAPIYSHSSKSSPNIPATMSSLKSQKIHVLPKSFNNSRTTLLQSVFKPSEKKTDSIVKGHPPGNVDTQMSSPIWSPRGYSSGVTSEAKGYTHVRRLKPGFDKTQLQATARRKFLETGFPKANQARYNHGLGLSATSERQLNLNYNSRGSHFSSWHPPPPGRTQTHVQGKFKPFQTRLTNDAVVADTHSDSEMGSTQTFAGTTPPPGLNSTGIASPVTGDWSTKSPSPTQTAGRDPEVVPQASNHEGQFESSEVGSSLEQNKPFTVSPSKRSEEKERKHHGVVSGFLETN